MNARPSTVLEIYGTRTPMYRPRPARRLPDIVAGLVVWLMVTALALLVVVPEVGLWLAESAFRA